MVILVHTPFSNYTARMQEGHTMKDWKESYKIKIGSEPSYYSVFPDAV